MKIKLIGEEPEVLFTLKAWTQIKAAVEHCNEEVSWLGLADRFNDSNSFIIEEIFIPQQNVHATTTEITPEGQVELYEMLIAEGVDTNRLRYHGHSHHSMGVNPSHQDNTEFLDFDDDFPFFIRTIHNKKGDIQADVIDRESGLYLEELETDIVFDDNEEIRAAVFDAVKNNVSKMQGTTRAGYNYGLYQRTPGVKTLTPAKQNEKYWRQQGWIMDEDGGYSSAKYKIIKRELVKVSASEFKIVLPAYKLKTGEESVYSIHDEAFGGSRLVVKDVKNDYKIVDLMVDAPIGYWRVGTVEDLEVLV